MRRWGNRLRGVFDDVLEVVSHEFEELLEHYACLLLIQWSHLPLSVSLPPSFQGFTKRLGFLVLFSKQIRVQKMKRPYPFWSFPHGAF